MQNKYPQKPGIDFILKQAFFYWNRTLFFQLAFSIIYFSIFFTAVFFFAERYGIWDQQKELLEAFKVSAIAYKEKAAALANTENSVKFSYAFLGILTFLYPLNLGFFQIYKKIDLNEKLELGDLLAGYNGFNFFKYIGYYLFWIMIFLFTFQTIILAILWSLVTILVAPLMFFDNKRIFEAISLNFKALKLFSIEIFVCIIVACFFKYLGFIIFLVGGLFTFPFWNAMIYSLYKVIFSEK
ncbi:hypothetical protein D1632_01525 [Chryseobacterium nematophagum]|uniref:Beta-carotene 15,15'-monooxygenase n=1 Tax=Chryseobacterium nematophagum TaxID=2305228 RepID=A0A3M7LD39_9FLAO|nr:hypothetical protein [Chryseobacterium nematophagum]RMZ60688.1 hypothetical protein D1632_01525 [Chryseobacterium nematophagum]